MKDQWLNHAPVAQLDRVPGYEPGGREFESLRARHLSKFLGTTKRPIPFAVFKFELPTDKEPSSTALRSSAERPKGGPEGARPKAE